MRWPWLLWLARSSHVVALSVSFRPSAAPRFDVFAEQLVGVWRKTDDDAPHEVTEVMRSCGGAVQGLRDWNQLYTSSMGVDECDTLYLNRANDGFCFWQCGSYSWGPTQLLWVQEGTTTSNEPDCNLFQVSIQVSDDESPPKRIVLACQVDSMGRMMASSGTLRVRQPKTNPSPRLDIVTNTSFMDEGFVWHDTIQCRMATLQPWSLQRVAWETLVDEDVETYQLDATEQVEPIVYQASISLQSDNATGTVVWHCTVVNCHTGQGWGCDRRYDATNGRLQHVALRRGWYRQ